ncbi:hypothetical protein DUI87_33600 [Hirundo rustica rustica]|uniref:Sushi domain-containing protein n=1 Tax=Hirundo rustica rustica TaxID=333673 RepID=A0A3M0INM8_HIRRU|nr:hypothetical protein DUI87_33600 [Hirundo rustica rustica]
MDEPFPPLHRDPGAGRVLEQPGNFAPCTRKFGKFARCSRPKAVANAHIDAGNRTELNSRLRYSCKPGYKRKAGTSSLIQCILWNGSEPRWTDPTLQCILSIQSVASSVVARRDFQEWEIQDGIFGMTGGREGTLFCLIPFLKCRFLWISRSQLLEDEAGLEERHHIIPREPGNFSGAGNILLHPPGI